MLANQIELLTPKPENRTSATARTSTSTVWLTDTGRAVALRIHEALHSIEADLLGRLDPAESLAIKHLLRSFIVQTDGGLPHPCQDGR